MSTVVRIVAPDQVDRLVPLANGSRKLGASLQCAFLVLDQGIADEQFAVQVDDDRVTLTLLPEAQALLDGVPMVPGVEIVLKLGMEITVGEVVFSFRGGAIDAAAGLGAPETGDQTGSDVVAALTDGTVYAAQPVAVRPAVWKAGAGAVGLSLAALLWVGLSTDVIAMFPSGSAKDDAIAPAMSAPGATASMAPPAERFMSDLPTAEAMSNTSKSEVSATSKQAALKASAIVLAGIDRSALAQEIQDGVLQVSGVRADDPKAEDMRRALMADIPTLDNVSFSLNAEDRITAMKDQVAGIWAGKRPYVVLIDGEVIKPNQELHDGVILTAVFEKHIEVAIGTDQHKVDLQ